MMMIYGVQKREKGSAWWRDEVQEVDEEKEAHTR